jgi:hypothetical protein
MAVAPPWRVHCRWGQRKEEEGWSEWLLLRSRDCGLLRERTRAVQGGAQERRRIAVNFKTGGSGGEGEARAGWTSSISTASSRIRMVCPPTPAFPLSVLLSAPSPLPCSVLAVRSARASGSGGGLSAAGSQPATCTPICPASTCLCCSLCCSLFPHALSCLPRSARCCVFALLCRAKKPHSRPLFREFLHRHQQREWRTNNRFGYIPTDSMLVLHVMSCACLVLPLERGKVSSPQLLCTGPLSGRTVSARWFPFPVPSLVRQSPAAKAARRRPQSRHCCL